MKCTSRVSSILSRRRILPSWMETQKIRSFATIATIPVVEVVVSPDMASDLADIVRPYFEEKKPILLRNAVGGAPAIEKWKEWSYFKTTIDEEQFGHVEIGGNYLQSERADIPVVDYFSYMELFEQKYGRSGDQTPPPEALMYLAQNDLPPMLDGDFTLPSFYSLGHGNLYSVMLWVGPYGCVSPLHFDPLDNTLMQFVGVKKVILFASGTQCVYAGIDASQSNTSPIDFEEELDLNKYPLLSELPPAQTCMIYPGDALYIPAKWWHQVRTCETSVSVNGWWR